MRFAVVPAIGFAALAFAAPRLAHACGQAIPQAQPLLPATDDLAVPVNARFVVSTNTRGVRVHVRMFDGDEWTALPPVEADCRYSCAVDPPSPLVEATRYEWAVEPVPDVPEDIVPELAWRAFTTSHSTDDLPPDSGAVELTVINARGSGPCSGDSRQIVASTRSKAEPLAVQFQIDDGPMLDNATALFPNAEQSEVWIYADHDTCVTPVLVDRAGNSTRVEGECLDVPQHEAGCQVVHNRGLVIMASTLLALAGWRRQGTRRTSIERQ